MEDFGGLSVGLGVGLGAITLRTLIFGTMRLIQKLEPGLRDRGAVLTVMAVSAVYTALTLVALAVWVTVEVAWDEPEQAATGVAVIALTFLALFIYLSETAMGYYADLFKVSEANLPRPPDAHATEIEIPSEEVTIELPSQPAPPLRASRVSGRREAI